jgi:acyl dehydratase
MASAQVEINGFDELTDSVGREATTDWHEVTQDAVQQFARASGDFNPLHVDEEFASQTPFGGTIAHGVLTLALIPAFLESLWQLEGFGAVVLYGFNRVRFPAPLPVGERVRMHLRITSVRAVDGGAEVVNELTFEREGGDEKPVCVVEHVIRALAATDS